MKRKPIQGHAPVMVLNKNQIQMLSEPSDGFAMPSIQKKQNAFAKKEKFSGKLSSGSFGSVSSLEEIYGSKPHTIKR